ncbi:BRISC complex subunit Abro1 protein [Trifolium repens]|nr:BRISC complex subunit Abro1 protein [Trifolium repens]
MDDLPPLQKIAISGPTLASLIHRFSTTTSSSSIDGLLFGHVTFVTPLNLSDDSSDTSQTLVATVTGFLTSSSFHNTSGTINTTSLRRLIPHNTSLLGWFSGRRRTPLRPSLREFTITSSLSSLSQFSSTIKPNSDSNSNSFSSSSSSFINFNPSLFFLLASPISDQTSHIHTHDYRAYQFLTGTQSFNPVSIDIINIGPAFRGHYGSFIPNSPFPALDCQLSYSPMIRDEDDEKLSKMKQAAKDQRELDILSEGFEVGRLSKLMGSDAKNYTQSLEDLYLKMLVKIENLTALVEESSAKVLEQENHNKKLKQKILRSAAVE